MLTGEFLRYFGFHPDFVDSVEEAILSCIPSIISSRSKLSEDTAESLLSSWTKGISFQIVSLPTIGFTSPKGFSWALDELTGTGGDLLCASCNFDNSFIGLSVTHSFFLAALGGGENASSLFKM